MLGACRLIEGLGGVLLDLRDQHIMLVNLPNRSYDLDLECISVKLSSLPFQGPPEHTNSICIAHH